MAGAAPRLRLPSHLGRAAECSIRRGDRKNRGTPSPPGWLRPVLHRSPTGTRLEETPYEGHPAVSVSPTQGENLLECARHTSLGHAHGRMMIDLRSDTVTKPTEAMRKAMARAEVGDDVYGEDPTVNRLQDMAAAMLGKKAALFVPSGTMANQLSIRIQTQPGQEVIVESKSHIVRYEQGAAGALSGVQLHWVSGERGIMTAEQIEAAIRPKDPYS